jgi:hypothetical protein
MRSLTGLALGVVCSRNRETFRFYVRGWSKCTRKCIAPHVPNRSRRTGPRYLTVRTTRPPLGGNFGLAPDWG